MPHSKKDIAKFQKLYLRHYGKNLSMEDTRGSKTYYVYDDFDLLRYVLSPEASDLLVSQSGEIGNYSDMGTIEGLCYYYKYDDKKRLIEKKLPGENVEIQHLVYDDRDRLVMTQDGNLREKKYWLFTKYDELNRPIITGKYFDEAMLDQEGMQEAVNTFYNDEDNDFFETLVVQNEHGYSNQSFPNLECENCEVHNITYYDTYNFISQTQFEEYWFKENSLNQTYDTEYTKGKITTTKTKVLFTPDIELPHIEEWLTAALYYDEYDHIIQTVGTLAVGGINVISNQYNFTGELLETLQEHIPLGSLTPTLIKQAFTYDHVGRTLSGTHQINDDPIVELSSLKYDELGELLIKRLHKNAKDKSWTQNLNYKYNIRNWLTDINDVENMGNDYFSMQLLYTNTTYPQYNGNIAKMECNYGDISGAYEFSYDGINRLKTANYDGFGNYGADYSYDANGNILTLNRRGMLDSKTSFGIIDELDYSSYNGNQLLVVDDIQAQQNQMYGFVDDGSFGPSDEYKYDNNGNMVFDLNKSILEINYNYLNLPTDITIIQLGVINKIYYMYDAAGNKLCQQPVANNGAIVNTTNYLGNFVYVDNELQYILTSEGRILPNEEKGFDYQYFIKDHLGNTRILFNEEGVLNSSSYYPFGMLMRGFGDYETVEVPNKYLYNGKELQDDFGLEWYDYGARYYDPQLGRWHVTDPMAHLRTWVSPYNFVQNNPIMRTDPTGALDGEYDVTHDKNGNEVKTKTSPLGDAEGIDFNHHLDGAEMGNTEIVNNNTGTTNWINGGVGLMRGYAQRGNNTDWNSIFSEWKSGTGAQNSLMFGRDNTMNKEIRTSNLYHDARNSYLKKQAFDFNGKISKGSELISFANYFPALRSAALSGTNMTMQMMGTVNVSFYNIGNHQRLVFINDSKSVGSFNRLGTFMGYGFSDFLDNTPTRDTKQSYMWIDNNVE